MARWVAVFACVVVVLGVAPGWAVAQPAGDGVVPPPLPSGYPPPRDDGSPDRVYEPDTQCVGSLPGTEPITYIPWGQDVLRFRELSSLATGAGQKVAVIDTGVSDHDYFGGRLEGGGDYVVQGGDGLEDCDGHGTAVAGIIAANPNDEGIGFRGIAPDARIVSIRQSSGNYSFKDPATDDPVKAGNLTTLAKSIVRAADTDGVTVINISINNCRAADRPFTDVDRNLQAALHHAVVTRDVVVVASAGNVPDATCTEQNGPDPRRPALVVYPPWFSEYVLSVGAVGDDGAAAEFSLHGPWVSVAAPGTEIVSLDPADRTRLTNQTVNDKGQPSPIQGTSFAAPYVAGLAALVRERFADLSATQVMERIKITSAHPAATGGHDDVVGYGMVNPMAALTAFIPEEKGIPRDEVVSVPFEMPPPAERDWTPFRVAVIGAGGGMGLLLLTLFVVRTARRNRY
jgi:membrane-anchored mycosin MYCP